MQKLKWLLPIVIVTVCTSLTNCNDVLEDTIVAIRDTTLVNKDTTTIIRDTTKVVNKDTTVVIKDTTVVNKDTIPKEPPVEDPIINLIFDGDSQTKRGYYPSRTIELLKSGGYTVSNNINFGVSGQNTLDMITDVASQIIPKYNSKCNRNIVCFWIGANDAIRDESTDTARLYRNLLTYYTSLKKAGFKVVMINLPDANHHIGTNKINALYDRVHTKVSDIYVNCRVTGGAFENNKDLKYYTTDGIHLNPSGFTHLAEKYVYPKLKVLIDSSKL